ncbi:30S ribosomal protein S1-like protein [Anoxybacillus flavithermus TNO-09.006]|uniref:30S ribosomal protein S1 n=1 Tax=Anoxybacillus flavithermus TaxID=33934 RepID=UPI0002A6F9BC|nr:30S ribosomal protein S1 [Anoxybacillus flavithermus]ELK22228.1 30S ribosomal protein S1-like protein [Anoxybacillus flavithermus TNO-09.006]MBE2912473.1 30S ribosomal protein S1 [Anoxybacillus flavithermus]MBE2939667.1 30S ribosomal protein S1 [Anoxybacillus flavithermus]MBE2942195.1 30S ribosomal protein S1 [Anoxybacillus flavithermus]MBE2950468.1 30S ribosomal protein S1 [Anoxybacillus flavithermus]
MEEMNQVDVRVYEVGDTVKGQVTKVEDKQVLVDVEGSKLVGIIPISELSSLHIEKASDVLSVGDAVIAKVKKVEDEALILSKKAADAEKAWEELERKLANGDTFNVVVKDIVKGGLVADVGVRAFIPASLVEKDFVEDFTDYKGRTLAVKVIELDREKNRVVLSHRAVIEEEESSKKKAALQSLQVGQVLEGTVARITNFGVFVNIGDVDGLVHISQLAHTRVDHPSDVVKEGDVVKVKVLAIDEESGRVSLSMKAALPAPWDDIEQKIKEGDVLEGTVKRLAPFGAFVEVLPGVEGLVHISQISTKHIGTPHEVLKEGDVVKVKVLAVNEQEKRLSLSIRELLEDDVQEDYREYTTSTETTGFQIGEVIGEQLKKLK